jgi:hypothetical protein
MPMNRLVAAAIYMASQAEETIPCLCQLAPLPPAQSSKQYAVDTAKDSKLSLLILFLPFLQRAGYILPPASP